MSVEELKEQHVAATANVDVLRERLKQTRLNLLDTDVARHAKSQGRTPISFGPTDLVCCRTLQGHSGKVYSLDWTPEKNRIVSASQDGRLIVWNALTSQKTHAIKLPCAWVMTCAFSPSGQYVACGGLDNLCSTFNLNSPVDKDGNLPISRMLSGHKGYVSSCQYVPDEDTHLITSSGDQTCVLWDVSTGQRISVFGGEFPSGHTADVLSVSINATNPKIFVSGSCDTTARLWDTRKASRAQRTFHGHKGDVNTVKFFPDGQRFGTGSDDGTCRLFDVRTGHELQVYRQQQQNGDDSVPVVTSIAFSISGRLLFVGYSNGDCYVWDTLLAKVKQTVDGMYVTQQKYAKNLVKKFGLEAAKIARTPMGTTNKLSCDLAGQGVDQKEYRSMIGSLLYLTASRPDISYSVGACARYQANPKESHLTAVKRIIRYVKGTMNYGLMYSKNSGTDLYAYSDADWAGNVDDRKSTSGGCFYVGHNLVAWQSKKQNSQSLSTAEAEYIAAGSCCTQLLWMKQMLNDYGYNVDTMTVYCDNTSAIDITKNPVQHSRTKHIDIRHHFIRELVENKIIRLVHVPTKNQLADILTKPLDSETFENLRRAIGVVYVP